MMAGLKDLRFRLERCRASLPAPEPWPPEAGSLDWCAWLLIGQPAEQMKSVDMLAQISEKVWSGVSEAKAIDIEEAIC